MLEGCLTITISLYFSYNKLLKVTQMQKKTFLKFWWRIQVRSQALSSFFMHPEWDYNTKSCPAAHKKQLKDVAMTKPTTTSLSEQTKLSLEACIYQIHQQLVTSPNQ